MARGSVQGFATNLLEEVDGPIHVSLGPGAHAAARAAYQVGFLRLLAREFPDVVPGILTGVSAGGINAAYLATHQESFAVKVERLAEVWPASGSTMCSGWNCAISRPARCGGVAGCSAAANIR